MMRSVARWSMHTVRQKVPKVRDARAKQEQLVRDILSGAVSSFPCFTTESAAGRPQLDRIHHEEN